MKKLLFIAAIGLGSLSFQACNNQQASNNTEDTVDSMNSQENVATTDEGTDFLTEAASGGMMEVELGKLAQSNAASAEVKNFGSMMVTDHSKANEELKTLAASKNVTLPTVPLKDQQDMIDDLKEKTGADFDKAYMSMMVDDHKEDIDKFEDAAGNNEDPDVKAFASKTLPVLKKHLASAQQINDALNNL